MTMTLPARAKINWALNITGRRPDGYHLLDMLMQTISLEDELTLEEADELSLTVIDRRGDAGSAVPVPAGADNLVLKAARALKALTGTTNGARLTLVKRVPAQAGLGGGSADCAAALTGLNAFWGLGLSPEALMALGAQLGADVPFCLTGGLARVQGIGEQVTPLGFAPQAPLVLLKPRGGLSTPEVYRRFDAGFPGGPADIPGLIDALRQGDLPAVARLTGNALAAPAIEALPEIETALGDLRGAGADVAFMTGSGSAVVGVFSGDAAARRAADALPGAILVHTLG